MWMCLSESCGWKKNKSSHVCDCDVFQDWNLFIFVCRDKITVWNKHLMRETSRPAAWKHSALLILKTGSLSLKSRTVKHDCISHVDELMLNRSPSCTWAEAKWTSPLKLKDQTRTEFNHFWCFYVWKDFLCFLFSVRNLTGVKRKKKQSSWNWWWLK